MTTTKFVAKMTPQENGNWQRGYEDGYTMRPLPTDDDTADYIYIAGYVAGMNAAAADGRHAAACPV